MKPLVRQVTRLALYALIPLGTALAPLVVIPAATARYGAAGWASIAVALSIGLAGAVIAELGWGIVGPQQVARDRSAARAIYADALASRLVAVSVLAPVCACAAAVLADGHAVAAVLLALGVLTGALSPAWFFTGLGRPGVVLRTETLPRIAAGLGAAVAIALGAPLEAYGTALVLAAAVTQALAGRAGAVTWPPTASFRRVVGVIRRQGVVTFGRSVSTLYKALPATILAWTFPSLVAVFSATDRPMRMGLQVLTALPQRLQVWVGVDDHALALRRSTAALGLNVVLGLVAGTVFAWLMPVVAPVLFSGQVDVPAEVAVVGGLLVLVICASRGLGLALVAARCAEATTHAAVASAVVGLPGVWIGASTSGVSGALMALVLAEVAGVFVQAVALVRVHRAVALTA